MKGFDKLHIKSAVSSYTNCNLSKNHITTLNFGQVVPIYVEELVPGDKFNIKNNAFARLAPLSVPTYSNDNLKFNTFSVFCPFHQVWEAADSYISGNTLFRGHSVVMPYFKMSDLHYFFNGYCLTDSTATDFNYSYIDSSGQTFYRKFTTIGKFYFKILKCLGYDLPRAVDWRTDSNWVIKLQNVNLNALPLLCFSHSWNSWLSQSTKTNTSELSSFLYDIKFGNNITDKFSDGHLSYFGIYLLLKHISVCYDNSYFTAAWESPNNPLNSMRTISSMPGDSSILLNTQDTLSVNNTSSTYSIAQRTLDYLKRFDSWARRTNLSGSKEIEQIYSKFGIKIDDYKTRYPYKLNYSSDNIQIGDVTSTADSNGVVLGDYAGKGVISSNSNFKFECHDYGMIITLGWISVKPLYYQGFHKSVLRNSPLDFYDPTLDGLQAQAISRMELLGYTKENITSDTDTTKIFGFLPRYSEYLFPRDVISGDMLLYQGYDSWHLGRNLGPLNISNHLTAQSDVISKMYSTESEYDRIFNITSNDEDKFFMTFYFDVNANRPMKSLSAKTELGDGDLTVDRNGSQTV